MFVIDAYLSSRTPGLSFRKSKAGPEQELLDWFLQQKLFRVPRGHNVSIFREPRLPSGYPDLVIVVWDASVARQWTSERGALTPSDLRVMHFLGNEGPKEIEELRGVFSAAVDRQLDRLGKLRWCAPRKAAGKRVP
jgi:hypothetical protein